MIIIKSLEIENYRNIKHVKLSDLKDLNILIGPNNCGKTNILELINSLCKLGISHSYNYLCEECKKLQKKNKEIECIYLPIELEDFYLKEDPRKVKVRLKILFDREQIDKLVPRVLKKQEELLDKMTIQCQHIEDSITLESRGTTLYGVHFSPFIHRAIINEIRRSILYCPEGRLQNYKGKNFDEYLSLIHI